MRLRGSLASASKPPPLRHPRRRSLSSGLEPFQDIAVAVEFLITHAPENLSPHNRLVACQIPPPERSSRERRRRSRLPTSPLLESTGDSGTPASKYGVE